jgi:hypothetical protein
MKAIKQASPTLQAEHFKIISSTGFGTEIVSDESDKGENEDPFVAQARIAAENTRSRDKARRTDSANQKSVLTGAPKPKKRMRGIDVEIETAIPPKPVSPKRKKIIK